MARLGVGLAKGRGEGAYRRADRVLRAAAVAAGFAGFALGAAPGAVASIFCAEAAGALPQQVLRKAAPLLLAQAWVMWGAARLQAGSQVQMCATFGALMASQAMVTCWLAISGRWTDWTWVPLALSFAGAVAFANFGDQILAPKASRIDISSIQIGPVASSDLQMLYGASILLGGCSGLGLALVPMTMVRPLIPLKRVLEIAKAQQSLPVDGSPGSELLILDASRLLGALLAGEAVLAFFLRSTRDAEVHRLGLQAFFLRSWLSTLIALANQLSGVWAPANWTDFAVCVAFLVPYAIHAQAALPTALTFRGKSAFKED